MKQIPLSKGLFALVNDEDFDWIMQWKWSASEESRGTKFYAVRFEQKNRKRKKIRMHVEVVKRKLGISEIPKGKVVDHKNHNSLDNRWWNDDELEVQLEIVTQSENMNRSKGWKKKGVSQRPSPLPPPSGGEKIISWNPFKTTTKEIE